MQRRVSRALCRPVAEITEFIEQQPTVYVDETGWREKDKQPWLWVKASENAIVFQILSGRKRIDAQMMIGKNATGVITTDRFGSYNYLDRQHRQICWAHLKRDLQAIAERDGDSKAIGEALIEQTKRMFEQWQRVRDGTIKRAAFVTQAELTKQQINRLLIEGTALPHSKTSNTCRNILKLESALWTFTRRDEVEPTNNQAERALR